MRTLIVLSSLFCVSRALAGPLTVHVIVKEERTSWQPIDPDDVERTLSQAALEALSKSGQLKLVVIDEKDARKNPPEYVLRIGGRMLDEAETHTVYLSFEPRSGANIGSLRAAETVAIGGQAKATMLQRMEQSAKRAASELWASLSAVLGRAQNNQPPPPVDTTTLAPLPWKWADVITPPVRAAGAAEDLYAKEHDLRMAALRELASLALSKSTPRHALEACALKHPIAQMRVGCLNALRPLARRSGPTQRVVIQAFRKDDDRDVVEEANEQMLYFTGLSQADAVAAWMEQASKGIVRGPLAELGDLPNLDLVVVRCLLAAGAREKHQRSKDACIKLLEPISFERKKAILWPFLNELNPDSAKYLEGAGQGEHSRGTDWQRAVEALLEDAPAFPKGLDEILWRRYERTLSASSLDLLASHAPATELLAGRFIEVIQSAGGYEALNGLSRFIEENEKLRPMIVERLSELLATEAYHKSVSKDRLQQLIKKAKGETPW